MTGREAVDQCPLVDGLGWLRVRDPRWVEPGAYLRVTVLANPLGRSLGPWAHLFSRQTQELIGEPTPQRTMILDKAAAFFSQDWEVWTGPTDPADDR